MQRPQNPRRSMCLLRALRALCVWSVLRGLCLLRGGRRNNRSVLLLGAMKHAMYGAIRLIAASAVSIGAQWPKFPAPDVSRDAQGKVLMDAPAPRTAD